MLASSTVLVPPSEKKTYFLQEKKTSPSISHSGVLVFAMFDFICRVSTVASGCLQQQQEHTTAAATRSVDLIFFFCNEIKQNRTDEEYVCVRE